MNARKREEVLLAMPRSVERSKAQRYACSSAYSWAKIIRRQRIDNVDESASAKSEALWLLLAQGSAPAAIQLRIVSISASVRHTVPFIASGQSSGMRAPQSVRPLSSATIIAMMRLVSGLPGTASGSFAHAALAPASVVVVASKRSSSLPSCVVQVRV